MVISDTWGHLFLPAATFPLSCSFHLQSLGLEKNVRHSKALGQGWVSLGPRSALGRAGLVQTQDDDLKHVDFGWSIR